tara:strand:- start:144 stop:836 length:693 start_codon:yes stop_codon:yes gene_type:complete
MLIIVFISFLIYNTSVKKKIISFIQLTPWSKKKITLFGGRKSYSINLDEIYPLKKYKFYNFEVMGPNKVDFLLEHYGKNLWTMGKRKHAKYFKIKDKRPASIDNNYKGCSQNTKRCLFYLKKNNYLTPPCCARNLTSMLYHLKNILEKNNIEYFIYWGTLVGSIRHQGLIPWDTDIDIYMNGKDIPKLLTLIEELEKPGFNFVKENSKFFRLNYSKINTQHVDIYTFIED